MWSWGGDSRGDVVTSCVRGKAVEVIQGVGGEDEVVN